MTKLYKTRELGRVKRYSNSKDGGMESKSALDQVYEETKILKMINHPNCVLIKESLSFEGKLYLIFPFYSTIPFMSISGPLSYVHNFPELRHRTIDLLRDLLTATKYVHGLKIAHRDIKPDNILWNGESFILSDFGSAAITNDGIQQDSPGTIGFYPPEICVIDPPSSYSGFQADLWAVGLVVWCSLFGALPYQVENPRDMINLIDTIADWKLEPISISHLDEVVQERLESLLNRDPSLRTYS
jgi:serine/threonine protein kinase